jgi:tetratricopeptide (TPR) repeat protein
VTGPAPDLVAGVAELRAELGALEPVRRSARTFTRQGPPGAITPHPIARTDPEPTGETDQRQRSPSGSIEIGALRGDFRPSGLRKIDEAVRAAQLIAPELLADDDLPSLPSLAFPAAAEPGSPPAGSRPAGSPAAAGAYVFDHDGGSIPDEYLDEAPTPGVPSSIGGAGVPRRAADGPTPRARSEGTGPRILASNGADQAQVSGELPYRSDDSENEITARELVTIKPRRITREMPAVVPSPELLAEAAAAEAAAAEAAAAVEAKQLALGELAARASRVSAEMASTTIPRAGDSGQTPVAGSTQDPPLAVTTTAMERSRPPSRPPQGGSGTSRDMTAPPVIGWMPWVLGAIGLALMAAAYVRCRDVAQVPSVAAFDASALAAGSPDAAVPGLDRPQGVTSIDAPRRAPVPDARVAAVVDAAVAAKIDAPARGRVDGVSTAPPAVPGHREFRDAAQDALADNDYEAALELADKSLALAKSARTYLIKADAQRRLGQVDQSLATVDAALGREPNYAPAWEMKGRILWGARRTDEGRAAYEKYLQLRPTGATADRIREILGK